MRIKAGVVAEIAAEPSPTIARAMASMSSEPANPQTSEASANTNSLTTKIPMPVDLSERGEWEQGRYHREIVGIDDPNRAGIACANA